MAKKENKTQQPLENIEESLTKAEEFIINNQKILSTIVIIIVVLILGFFGFKRYYIAPKNKEAQEQIYPAQHYFQVDSLSKALYGDGNNLGFVDIAKMYSITKAGKLANYYAGLCFLKKGEYNQAIKYLSKFKPDDQLVAPMAKGALGDAYLSLGNKDKAISMYMEAATMRDNDFTSPMFLLKAGEVYEDMGNYDKAINVFNKIKTKYDKSSQAANIDKYIARAEALKANK